MVTKEDLAYVAGLIDGEGCLRIAKHTSKAQLKARERITPEYEPRIDISMTEIEPLLFIQKIFGGYCKKVKEKTEKTKAVYKYVLTRKQLEILLQAIYPYLIVKKQHANILFQFLALQAQNKSYRTRIVYRTFKLFRSKKPVKVRRYCLSDEYISLCDKFYLKIRYLNSGFMS